MKYRIFLNKVDTLSFLGWYRTTDSVQREEVISLRRTIKNDVDHTTENKFWRVEEVVRQVRLIDKDEPRLLFFEEFLDVDLIVEELPPEEIERLFPSTLPL